MRKIWVAAWVVVAACTGDTGPTGPTGPAGTNGTNGTDGTNGMNGSNGSNGNDIIISDTAKHGLDISPVTITTTGLTAAQVEAIGQGSYLVNALADCGKCHGEAGTTPGFLAGVATATTSGINPRNLTPDTATGLQLSETEFIAAMRTGANYACTGGTCTASTTNTMVQMPWTDYRWASLYDLKAIYAYLRAIPGVTNAVPADTGTLGAAPAAFPTSYTDGAVVRALPAELDTNNNPIPDPGFARRGMALQFVDEVDSSDATTDARIGRGSYLINSFGRCRSCHSKTSTSAAQWLTGGKVFTIPATVRSMTADLVGKTHGFFAEPTADFTTFEGILQTGTHVDDTPAAPLAAPMPWQFYRYLTLDDLAAVYTYLQEVQAGVVDGTVTQITDDTIAQDASFYCTADTQCDQANGETCDLTSTDTTYHECIGRSCNVSTDCRVCQVCSGTGGTCGAFVVSTTCKSL